MFCKRGRVQFYGPYEDPHKRRGRTVRTIENTAYIACIVLGRF